jgi:predicted nucleotide-binding protein (sugar kinase/HSP70/actin superfamily)
MTRLGILRCLLYYPLYPFWKAFFEELGFSLVVSPPMTSRQFDEGARRFVGDICLPIESAFGHIEAIKHDVDLLFLPRSNELHRDVYVCPACAGLPYVVRHTMPEAPEILSLRLTPFRALDRAGVKRLMKLGIAKRAVRSAFARAQEAYRAFVQGARAEPFLSRAIARATGQECPPSPPAAADGPRVLLLGMPYVLGDSFVNQGIPAMLAARGVRITTPYMLAPDLADREVAVEGYWLYWTFGGMSVAAMTRQFERGGADGIVYVSSFACGVDSLITPIVQSAARRRYRVPFLLLVVDEHAEAAHLAVRIEAFLDCVRGGVFAERSSQ